MIQIRDLLPGHLITEVQSILLENDPAPVHIQSLMEQEFALSSEQAHSLTYQLIAQLNATLFPPLNQIELIHTEGCNLSCTYCFENPMLGYRRMTPEIAQAAIDLLFVYSQDQPVLQITHFGGEPTLNFSAIKQATEYAEEKALQCGKSLEFSMTSNGTLITESMADYLARHRIKVLLSIDGLESTHNRFRVDKHGGGTFERAMKGFRILKRLQPWVGIKMTVMPVNVSSLFDDILGLYELGINQFIIGHATGVKWTDADMHSYGQQLNRLFHWYKEAPRQDLRITGFESDMESFFIGCQAGRTSISVTINGEISPCSKILALDNKHLLAKLGDVRFGLTHLRNRSELVSCSQLHSACEALAIVREYQGGCFASNYEETHSLFQPSMQEHKISMLERSAFSGCKPCQYKSELSI